MEYLIMLGIIHVIAVNLMLYAIGGDADKRGDSQDRMLKQMLDELRREPPGQDNVGGCMFCKRPPLASHGLYCGPCKTAYGRGYRDRRREESGS